MNAAMFVTLFDYSYWATDRVLAVAQKLAPPHWVVVPTGYSTSVQSVLVHLLSTERLWRLRLETRTTPAHLRAEDFPDVSTLRQGWREEEVAMRSYLSRVSDHMLGEAVQFRRVSGELSDTFIHWQLLMQHVTHGVNHRSETAQLLTAWRRSPGDLDFLLYLLEQPSPTSYRL